MHQHHHETRKEDSTLKTILQNWPEVEVLNSEFDSHSDSQCSERKYPKTALPEYSLLNYSEINIYLYAFLFGFAAIFGDMTKSFFKRKVGIKPGGMWFPFDQLDFIIMVLIFLSPFYTLPWQNILILLILTPPLHFVTNLTAYFIGMKRVWW